MAEAWARHLKGNEIEPYSAGLETYTMNYNTVKVMAESGVDMCQQYSKKLDDLKDISFDWVITVCDTAHENSPAFPGNVKKFHCNFDDPPMLAQNAKSEALALTHYRRVRDEIRELVKRLPELLYILSAP